MKRLPNYEVTEVEFDNFQELLSLNYSSIDEDWEKYIFSLETERKNDKNGKLLQQTKEIDDNKNLQQKEEEKVKINDQNKIELDQDSWNKLLCEHIIQKCHYIVYKHTIPTKYDIYLPKEMSTWYTSEKTKKPILQIGITEQMINRELLYQIPYRTMSSKERLILLLEYIREFRTFLFINKSINACFTDTIQFCKIIMHILNYSIPPPYYNKKLGKIRGDYALLISQKSNSMIKAWINLKSRLVKSLQLLLKDAKSHTYRLNFNIHYVKQ